MAVVWHRKRQSGMAMDWLKARLCDRLVLERSPPARALGDV